MSSQPRIAIMLPGQGSQKTGMIKALLQEFPWTTELFEEASEAIKIDLKKMCLEGPEDKLQLTENGQPAILTTSFAWFSVLERELDFAPDAGAGHSLGEYSALLCSGAMNLSQAVPLVRERGQRMQTAVPVGKGKMAAVIGLSDDGVRKLCDKASEGEKSLVVPVNYNAPSQVVVAGHAEAVDRAELLSKDKSDPEIAARKFMPLNVSAPFHSPLMKPVVDGFRPTLEKVQWGHLRFPIVFNVDAKIRREADVPALLTKQIDHPVLWTGCVDTLLKDGVTAFVEPGPGRVLSGLLKRISEEAKSFSVEGAEGVKALEAYLKGA